MLTASGIERTRSRKGSKSGRKTPGSTPASLAPASIFTILITPSSRDHAHTSLTASGIERTRSRKGSKSGRKAPGSTPASLAPVSIFTILTTPSSRDHAHTTRSQRQVKNVLVVKQVPDLAVKRLDRLQRAWHQFLPRDSQPDQRGHVAPHHRGRPEGARRRQEGGGDGGYVVQCERARGNLRNLTTR